MAPYSSSHNIPHQRRGLTAIDAITALIVILLVVQIWLLSATLDAYLAGHTGNSSAGGDCVRDLCVRACFAMYAFVRRVDRGSRPDR